MKFRKYEKILRYGKEETAGILQGTCYVQEKIDGANTSIWLDDNGVIQCGSRNRCLVDDNFNGFVSYARSHEGINNFLKENSNAILYGEWLVKHTIQYKHTFYKKFYLFDIYFDNGFVSPKEVYEISNEYSIDCVPQIGVFVNPGLDDLRNYVGKSKFGDTGEGIVIKNMQFINKFGDLVYAKLVCESFKEKNLLAFNDNDRHSEFYNEMYFVNKYMTLSRLRKIIEKLQPEINERLDMKHIPRVCETAYHDMLTEEIWEASKKIESINFKTLKNLSHKKAKIIYVDILDELKNERTPNIIFRSDGTSYLGWKENSDA